MQVAGYTRVSGQSQVSGDGHPRQEDSIRQFIKSHSAYVGVQFFNEDAVPGKSEIDDRPKFQEMIAHCLATDCKTIVVEALDRLAREYRVQEQLLIYIASKGLSLIAANTGENVTEALMGDPMRRALVQIQGILAELDKNLIVSKLMKARKRKRDAGERCEGQPPYGYKNETNDGITTLVPIHDEQIIIKMITDLKEWPPGDVADYLNGAMFSTRCGGKWHATQIRRIMERESCDLSVE